MNKILLPEYPGNNLLFHAIANSNPLDAVKLLESSLLVYADKEAQVNARNVNGASPLHIAVINQHSNLVQLLLKYGADVNLKVTPFSPRSTTI